MTALEIRLIAYAVLTLGLLGSAAYVSHKLTAMHYQAVLDADRAAQDKALQQAEQRVIAAQAAQAQAIQQAERDHATLVTADTASRDAILGSVRNLETALHLSAVSAPMANPGKPRGASPSSGRPDELAGLVDRLNSGIAAATAACQHDSTELAGILEIAPK